VEIEKHSDGDVAKALRYAWQNPEADALRARVAEFERKCEALKANCRNAEEACTEAKADAQTAQDAYEIMRAERDSARARIAELETNQKALCKEVREGDAELEEARAELADAGAQVDRLNTEIEAAIDWYKKYAASYTDQILVWKRIDRAVYACPPTGTLSLIRDLAAALRQCVSRPCFCQISALAELCDTCVKAREALARHAAALKKLGVE
jgi:hypothetical protein